jgi:hypothetical protein
MKGGGTGISGHKTDGGDGVQTGALIHTVHQGLVLADGDTKRLEINWALVQQFVRTVLQSRTRV